MRAIDTVTVRRMLLVLILNGELAHASPGLRSLVEHLAKVDPDVREVALGGYHVASLTEAGVQLVPIGSRGRRAR